MKILSLKIIFFLIIFGQVCFGSDVAFRIDFFDQDYIEFDYEMVAFITHPTSNYDRNFLTKEGVQKVANLLKNSNVPTFLGVNDGATYPFSVMADRYHLFSDDTKYTLETTSGAHNLLFPNGESFILAVGNLNFCLCRTISSILGSSSNFQKDVSPYIIVDATYLTTQYSKRNKEGQLEPFSSTLYHPSHGKYPSLKLSLSLKGNRELLEFFRTEIFNSQKGMCPNNIEGPTGLSLDDFKIDIFYDQWPASTIGRGKSKVSIHLIRSSQLSEKLLE